MTDPSQLCAVTNQSGSKAVVITPTTSDPDSTSGNIAVYDQNLEILTTQEGGETIANGGTGTVTLDQTYVDPDTGKTEESLLYDLLVSTSDWYYPLANLSVMQDFFDEPPSYPPQTATQDMAKAMSDTASFLQTISAYPTSQLTQNYEKAMSGSLDTAQDQATGESGSANDVSESTTDSVNAFFQSTESYQDVTLASVVAMQSYYDKFPFVWGQFQTTVVTYYLYGNDGATTTFQGSLVLTPPDSVDLTKPNGGYAIAFNPAKNPSDTTTVDVDTSKAIPITYENGLFLSDPSSDISQIAVRGTFMLKRNFTQVPTDTQILPVITGSVYGLTTIGYDSPQLSDQPDNSDFWDTLFHPQTSAEVFQSIMTIGSAIMMLHFFITSAWGIVKFFKGKISKTKDTEAPATKDELNSQLEDIKNELNQKIDDAVKNITDGREEAPADPEAALETLNAETQTMSDNMNAAKVQDGLEAQAETVETLEQYAEEMTPDEMVQLESTATDIKETDENLQQAIDSQENLGDAVETAQKDMDGINEQTTQLSNELSDTISADQQQSIEENAQLTEEVSETVDDMQKANEEDAAATDPEAGEEIEPEIVELSAHT